MRSTMLTPVSCRLTRLLTVITYGTNWPRVTLRSGVVLVIAMEPLSCGSSAMWLLKIWPVPGIWLPSSLKWTW